MPIPHLDRINPRTGGDKFSANLHAFLVKNSRRGDPWSYEVYEHVDGDGRRLYLGYLFDGDFIGTSLRSVMVDGKRAQLGSYAGQRFQLVADFWDRYLEVGRCVIDPKHEALFQGARWSWDTRGEPVIGGVVVPRRRTCLWCGHKQVRVEREKVVVTSHWVSDQGGV